MTCIAVIATVSKYDNGLRELPATIRDGQAIRAIINNEERFTDVLQLTDSSNGRSATNEILNFLAKYNGKDVDEVLFYFSGHGESTEDDVYYLMKDYKASQRQTTSIVNSQIDDAVRLISPKLFVKMIDACYSGAVYVKDTNAYPKAVERAKTGLNHVCFMFSSTGETKSYADNELSYFTESIIKSVNESKDQEIKYINVMNDMIDFFGLLDFQTPFFVNQGTSADTFCTKSDGLISTLAGFIKSVPALPSEAKETADDSLIAKIAKDAGRYMTKDQAIAALYKIKDIMAGMQLSSDLADTYNFNLQTSTSNSCPNREMVGLYLSRNKAEIEYFARPTYEEEVYDRKVRKKQTQLSSITSIMNSLYDDPRNYETIKDTRKKLVGFEHTLDIPFQVLHLYAMNNFPNLPRICCHIVPLISETTLTLCYCFEQYEKTDWDTYRAGEAEPYKYREVFLSNGDQITTVGSQLVSDVVQKLEAPIRAKFL